MPITAKLSKLFYERLGEQIANELVEWFNSVDATYRSDLRAMNELNFARSDAKLEQRLAQFEAKVEQRLAQFETKFDQRLAQFETKFEIRVEKGLSDLRVEFRTEIRDMKAELIKWMFLFWSGTTLAGLLFR